MSVLFKFLCAVNGFCWFGFRRKGGGFDVIGDGVLYGMLSDLDGRREFARRRYVDVHFVGEARSLWGLPMDLAFDGGGWVWFVKRDGCVLLMKSDLERAGQVFSGQVGNQGGGGVWGDSVSGAE